jgi:diguanylate cyclase (GGDEF)-like protein/PAS domain S-box-containing protein
MLPPFLHLRNFSLRTQIGWALGLVLSFTLVVQALLLFVAARTELRHSQAAQLDVLVNRVGAELDDKVGLRVSILEAMGKKFPVAALDNLTLVERYFASSPNLGTLFDDFYLFSPLGVLTIDWPVAPGRRGLDMAERDYIQGVIQTRKATISKPILGRATRQPIVVVAVPIYDDQGAVVGILGGVVNLQKSRLLEPLTTTRVGQTGYFYLVGPERLTMMHPDSRRLLQRVGEPGANPALDRALEGVARKPETDVAVANLAGPDDSTVEGVDDAGVPGLFSFERMPLTGWVLAAFLPASEALAAVDKLSTRVLASTLIFVILAVGLMTYLLRRVTQPLEQLTDFLNTSRSLAPPPMVLHNCRETDRLADAFGQFLVQQHSTQDQLTVAHQQAEASNADLRVAAIAFESQVGMFITDAHNQIVRVNHAFTHITGYSRAEALGHSPALLSHGRHDASFYAGLHQNIQRQHSWRGEVTARRKNGEVHPAALTLTVVTDETGVFTHQVGTVADISQRKAAEDEIQRLAFYDPLTQLPNRRLLIDRLEHALAASTRSGRMGALLFMDLDNFKVLNDSLGHDMGDLLLRQVGQRLQGSVREGDTVARLGGDEFVLVLEDLSQHITEAATQAEALGDKILAALNQAYDLAGQNYHCSASMGVAMWVGRLHSVDELMKYADLAMY